jgi:hypothetical protein
MRNLSIIALVALTSGGAGFWLGQVHVNRRDGSTARSSLSRNINVVVEGDSLQAGAAVLSDSLAVDGDLQIRSLPNGKLALAGNLNVRPN